jgi:phospholipase/carboxylesterase
VLIIDGSKDDRRMPDDGRRLAEQMKEAGAAVTHHQLPAGHAVTEADCALVREWLGAHFDVRNGREAEILDAGRVSR